MERVGAGQAAGRRSSRRGAGAGVVVEWEWVRNGAEALSIRPLPLPAAARSATHLHPTRWPGASNSPARNAALTPAVCLLPANGLPRPVRAPPHPHLAFVLPLCTTPNTPLHHPRSTTALSWGAVRCPSSLTSTSNESVRGSQQYYGSIQRTASLTGTHPRHERGWAGLAAVRRRRMCKPGAMMGRVGHLRYKEDGTEGMTVCRTRARREPKREH